MSDIWSFFNKIPLTETALCTICNKTFSCKRSSTKGLWDHLRTKHNDEFFKLQQSKEKVVTQEENQQQKITKFFDPTDQRQKAEELVLKLILRSNASFLLVESPELSELFQRAFPGFELRSRSYFRQHVLPKMFSSIKEQIRTNISDCYFAITTDGWSQPTSSPSLLSITIHSIDVDFNRSDYVLDAIPIESHSGDNIAYEIQKSLMENDIQIGKLIAIVRDDAKNMQKMSRILDKYSHQCVAHFLHLVINDALKVDQLKRISEKVHTWVKFCRTRKGAEIFKRHQEKQNAEKVKLVQSVVTRWNSVYRMLDAFRRQKKTLLSMESERTEFNLLGSQTKRARVDFVPDNLPFLSHNDLVFLRQICPLLEVFNTETERFSREKSTCSSIIPTLKRLYDFLTKEPFAPAVAGIVQNLAQSIAERMHRYRENVLLRISMLLDPRFAFNYDLFVDSFWKVIADELVDFAKEIHPDPEPETQNNELATSSMDLGLAEEMYDSGSDESLQKIDIWNRNPKSPCSASNTASTLSGEPTTSVGTKVEAQLALYKDEERLGIDGDVFSWWKFNGQRFPDLAKMARILHSIPATSVSSERLFSKAGLIYANSLRNRLAGKTVRKILVVKANMDNLKLAPQTEPDPIDMENESDED